MLVSAWKEGFDLLFESLIESIGPSKPPWNFSTEDADSGQAATPLSRRLIMGEDLGLGPRLASHLIYHHHH